MDGAAVVVEYHFLDTDKRPFQSFQERTELLQKRKRAEAFDRRAELFGRG